MRLLLVEDDALLRQALQLDLETYHYQIDAVSNGYDAWEYLQTIDYDLVILDVNIPGIDGIDLCRRIRQHQLAMPVLLLTALDTPAHKVQGLDAGADDYMVKPYQFDELAARVRALLRRPMGSRSAVLRWGELELDPGSQAVTYQGEPVSLSAKEYGLLELFLRSPQRVISMNTLIEKLWAHEEIPSEGTVRTLIKRLRQKLKAVGCADPLETVYGMGYRLKGLDDPVSEPKRQAGGEAPTSIQPQSTAPPLREAIRKLWDQFHPTQEQRLQVVATAVEDLRQGNLSQAQQQVAQQMAHKLAGSLGSFGLTEGSIISRVLETRLKEPLLPEDAYAIAELVAQLRSLLSTPLPVKPKVSTEGSSGPTRSPIKSPARDVGFSQPAEVIDQAQFVETLHQYFMIAQREQQTIGLLLLTVPQALPPLNLTLLEVARILRSQIRQGDLLGCWDNRQIAIALYGISRDTAERRLHQMLNQDAWRQMGAIPPSEITAGCALFPEDGADWEALLTVAQS